MQVAQDGNIYWHRIGFSSCFYVFVPAPHPFNQWVVKPVLAGLVMMHVGLLAVFYVRRETELKGKGTKFTNYPTDSDQIKLTVSLKKT